MSTPQAPSPSLGGRSFLQALQPLASDSCLHVGIDENGLGPVLGPLVVTGVAFRVNGPRPASLGTLVGDSKALVSHADFSLGEAWARALLGALGTPPSSPGEIVSRLSLDDGPTLRAPCPPPTDQPREQHAASMCWPAQPESFVADDELVDRCARIIRGWASTERLGGRFARKTPVELVGARAAIVCASRMNEARAGGRHLFIVDLHAMERVALGLHGAFARAGEPIDAVCGKVGGMDSYSGYFGPLSSRLCAIEAEGGAASAYRFPGLGRLTFLRDGDATDPLVGLASLVGKYLRELLMGRVVRYMRAAVSGEGLENELPNASGYRDPATKKFIAATALVRAARNVPDRCFDRRLTMNAHPPTPPAPDESTAG